MSEETKNTIVAAIDAAEVMLDPLDGLVERSANNPGAAFELEVLLALAALKKDDPGKFEVLRAQLGRAGIRLSALDEAIADKRGGDRRRGPTHAQILAGFAVEAALFHSPKGEAFADLSVNGHRETWAVRAKGFRQWLVRRFFEETESAPNSEAIQSALAVLEAKALHHGEKRDVCLRVAELGDHLYLDLCDDTWRVVEIDATGWRVISDPPVRFRRTSGMLPLPVPVRSASARESVKTLKSFINVQSEGDLVVVLGWLLAALRGKGPYPVMVLSGEQGSAKSTFSAILRGIVDPHSVRHRALSRDDRDLFIAANNVHVLAFDNVSGMPGWLSDTLCRLASGGGFTTRQLYSDGDEVMFDVARPIILNGIGEAVTRSDLADRSLFLTLEPIPDDRRRSEHELWADFNEKHPIILGALLDAASKGLAQLPYTKLDGKPRLADFALWGTACETAFWEAGTFMTAFNENRDNAIKTIIDADPVADAVRRFMADRTLWTGTASNLLSGLGEVVGEKVQRSKGWPVLAQTLSTRLRLAATFLRKIGIEIAFDRDTSRARSRNITITTHASNGGSDTTSAPRVEHGNGKNAKWRRCNPNGCQCTKRW